MLALARQPFATKAQQLVGELVSRDVVDLEVGERAIECVGFCCVPIFRSRGAGAFALENTCVDSIKVAPRVLTEGLSRRALLDFSRKLLFCLAHFELDPVFDRAFRRARDHEPDISAVAEFCARSSPTRKRGRLDPLSFASSSMTHFPSSFTWCEMVPISPGARDWRGMAVLQVDQGEVALSLSPREGF